MTKKIKAIIEQAMPKSEVHVFDPQNDGHHFQAVVVSSDFEGLSLVKQQQMVMNSLKNEFDSNTVHALALKTYTPSGWEKEKLTM